ncbi:hypothetical protein [Noviherbaspirillum aerium]|uniref:hypothetical protein n=1 Tax=Noviherbaspirillum aerium TaxID=2588497 RepID=UPI00124E646C|nr:hypothetical protein [Noviherbaspirillum aerium]
MQQWTALRYGLPHRPMPQHAAGHRRRRMRPIFGAEKAIASVFTCSRVRVMRNTSVPDILSMLMFPNQPSSKHRAARVNREIPMMHDRSICSLALVDRHQHFTTFLASAFAALPHTW